MSDLTAIFARAGLSSLSPTAVPELHDLDLMQLRVPGQEAMEHWRRLRELVEQTGRWPVIVGGPEGVAKLVEDIEFVVEHFPDENRERSLRMRVERCLQDATATPFTTWLVQQRDPQRRADELLCQAEKMERAGIKSTPETFRKWAEELRVAQVPTFDPAVEPWPAEETEPLRSLESLKDLDTARYEHLKERTIVHGPELYREATILLLPTNVGWQSPAFLFFGRFNECPVPSEHVAFARWAQEQYDAEIMAVSRDQIELYCGRPPADRDSALRLARDLRTYAEEVIGQGKTLGVLASALKSGSLWSCWWD